MSCHNKWVHFDGTVRHQRSPHHHRVLHQERVDTSGSTVKDHMKKIGFNVPTADFLGEGRDKADDIMEGATVVPQSRVVVPEDDELDEDETVDVAMREIWTVQRGRAGRGRTLPELRWSALGSGVHRTGETTWNSLLRWRRRAPFFALRELLQGANIQVLSFWESQDTALRFAKRNCRAQHVFAKSTRFLVGALRGAPQSVQV